MTEITDIKELAQRMKAAAVRAKAATEDYVANRMSMSVCLSECAEFNDLSDGPDNILLLVEALEKAQQSANINNQWKPDVCPITGRRFFMWIEHPQMGYVPTYGGPLDSYTIPTRDSDGEFSCERYDHDFGGWVDGECVGVYLIDDDEQCRVYELEQGFAELREQLRTVELSNSVLESRTVTPVTYSENADADYCRKWAWEQVKGEVSTEDWTTGDNITYFGFFCWGWDMRRQYNEQRPVTVKLPKRSVGEVMHMSGFSRDYAEGWCSGNDNAIHEMRVAGIRVIEGEKNNDQINRRA